MDVPIETRFKVLCEIVRAQHFAWREAALAMNPDLDPEELGNKMWEITGVQTAQAYLKEWVYDLPDHQAYLEKVGQERLEQLAAGRACPERSPEPDWAQQEGGPGV